MRLEFSQSTLERAQDEIRQLQLLGEAIKTALESTLVEPLPHELVFLLSLLEMKQTKIDRNSRFMTPLARRA